MNVLLLRFLKLVLVTGVLQLALNKSEMLVGGGDGSFETVMADINGKLDVLIRFILEKPFNLTSTLFEKFSNFK
jgi:hypothetical protein